MEALILSCSTGGGHNAAGYAVKEAMQRRGHHVTMLDPYSLVGNNLDRKVGNGYIRLAQKTPRFFGCIYHLGDLYRNLPIHSPVYALNKAMCRVMQRYLSQHHFDVILMPHVYPGEILTYMKHQGIVLPPLIFIATDYVCIPFTEETDCDYYAIPDASLREDFLRRGIPADKLAVTGIPVKRVFRHPLEKCQARRALQLPQEGYYLLLSGGSIGAGKMKQALVLLSEYLSAQPEAHLFVLCGNNQSLLAALQAQYGTNLQITLLASTDQISLYMNACDVYLSKPGGLSSTEAAVSGTPLIHLAPIPGCEDKNMDFFASRGMCIPVGDDLEKLLPAMKTLQDPAFAAAMRAQQHAHSAPYAAEHICELAETACGSQSAATS